MKSSPLAMANHNPENSMKMTKSIVLVGVLTLVLVAAGVAVKMIFFPSVDEKYFQVRNNVLQHAPPGLVIVRPTHFPKPPTNGINSANVRGTQWMVGRNVTFSMLIATAYGSNPGRMVLPVGAPKQNFDFLVTTPENPRERLQAAIRKKLGYTAQKETRDVAVLALKVETPNSDGLKISREGEPAGAEARNGRLYFTHQPLTTITSALEEILKIPMLDKSGLTNFYDFSLVWDAKTSQQIQNGTLDEETGRKILAEWGLGLEPDTASMEMLVVKKAD
jgi:uncharacterized protein (TIGR03435 family)